VPIELIETTKIGPSLGQATLESGVRALAIAFVFMLAFLVLWYRLPGLVAAVALGFYVAAMLAIFKIVPVTLTASGVAGFILSLGMAVDANILIFERVREELRKAKPLSEAIPEGFSRALLTFNGQHELVEERFNTVGPTLGQELATKAVVALILVVLAIILYVAYVFRQVSKPVSSWKYGLTAIVALVHDVVIALGTFALLGYMFGTEVDTLFVTALLVILGYSVNDSIVVLDRVRENLKDVNEKARKKEFDQIVGRSLKESLARSINTSITTLLALVALFIFGGDTTKDFALALIVGVVAGAYSSIFVAAPLLTTFLKIQKEKPEKKEEGTEGAVMQ
jgi:preprotein translocase SecF subunit